MTTLSEAAQQALEALELGYDSAKAEADQYHAAMAGYRQQRHAQMDADVQKIAAAITALRAALAEQRLTDMEQKMERSIESLKAALAEPCQCGDRPAAQCPGEWEPGCDLGNNPKYAKRVEMTPKELAASIKRGEKWKVAEPGSLMIAAQQFLEWNRAQSPPRVEVGFELGVFEAAMKAYAAPAQRPAEPVQEPVAGRAFLERILAAMEGVIDVADRKTDEFDALRSCVIDLTLMLHTAPPQRKPLTAEEITAITDEHWPDFVAFTRAIERAHEIV